MLTENDDESPHCVGTEPAWRESYYCNFVDPESNLCGVAWQGARQNAGSGEAVFLFCDGGEDIVRSVDTAVVVALNAHDPARKIGRQEMRCVEPWRRWDVHYVDGDDSVNVQWSQMSDICDWDWEELTRSKHFQAAGRVRVEASVRGRRIAFDGYGERDRAWGPRDYGPLQYSLFMTAQFTDDVAVHSFVMRDPLGQYRLIGYLHQDDVTRPLVSVEATLVYQGDRGPPNGGSYILIDDRGRRVDIETFSLLNHVGFGAADNDGSQLGGDLSKTRSLMFLTFQHFRRRDGVRGAGMIDLNCWVGEQRAGWKAHAPNFSKLYSFGRRS